MIHSISVAGYRSLYSLDLDLSFCNVFCGANGSGKSNFYQALNLLRHSARGGLISSLAKEGGMDSVLWAGPEKISRQMDSGEIPIQGTLRSGPVRLLLGFSADDFSYGIDLGFPQPGMTPFDSDPEIKNEWIWQGRFPDAKSLIVHRKGNHFRIRQLGKKWQTKELPLHSLGSLLSEYSDPSQAPEIFLLKELISGWRFYDSIRTDKDCQARKPQVGTFSPVLDADGSNLASAIRTIYAIGDREGWSKAIDSAFPGSEVWAEDCGGGILTVVRQPGMLRELTAAELSDGTLRFILLTAALFSPRPPSLMVLNEPETSLHPDLIPALGTMIADYGSQNQIVVITHSQELRRTISQQIDCQSYELGKKLGRTQVIFQEDEEASFPETLSGWIWPKR